MPSADDFLSQYSPNSPTQNTPNQTKSADDFLAQYNPKLPTSDEGFWQYQKRQVGNDIDNAVDYGGKVIDSVGQGISDLSDLGDSKTWTLDNDPNQYGNKVQGDIIQGNWSQLPKDIAGRVNEGFAASPPGKLLGGIGETVGAPIVPGLKSGIQKLDELGIPKEYIQFLLNVSPLLTKGLSAEEKPSVSDQTVEYSNPEPVSKAYQSTAQTAVNNGISTDQLMDIASKLKGDNQPPLTLPEALEDPTLLAKQRVLGEQGNQAGANFQEFNNNRLQNSLPAAKQGIIEQAGEGNVSTLADAGSTLQDAAKGIIDDAVKARTDQARPQYESIKNNILGDDQALSLRTNPVIENEYQKVINNDALMERQNKFSPEIPEQLKGLPPEIQQSAMAQLPNAKMVKSTSGGLDPNSIGAWDAVKKNLASQINSMEAQGRTQEKLYGLLNEAKNNIRDTLGETNPTYKTANDEYAASSPEITQMKKGPLGNLARAQTGENTARAFMNMTREQKQQIVPIIAKKNPEALPQIASAIIREATDKTSDRGLGAYIKALSGDKTVRDSMQAILSPDAYKGQQELISTLEKIQKGQPVNSTTQSKLATMQGINQEGTQGFDLRNIPTSKHGFIGSALDKTQQIINSVVQKLQEKHQTELMRVFTDPDLEQLGRAISNISDPQARANTSMGWVAKKLGMATSATALLGNSGANANSSSSPLVTISQEPLSYTKIQSSPQGTSDADMAKIAKAESGNNPNAKNPNSSASGLMQFTNRTWADMVAKYGKETGIKLGDKSNPQAQQVMARKYANQNIQYLDSTLGRMPTLGEVYMAHFLGPHGAAKLIQADPNKEAIMLYPRPVYDANRSIFFSGSRPRTVEEVRNILNKKVS